MEIDKVVLKFKKNEKGTVFTAFCDAYPQIQGKGQSEAQATTDFWRAFNHVEENSAHVITLQKKVAKEAPADGHKKKAA